MLQKVFPKEVWNLIFFEFNPTPVKQYLQTCLNNHYAISFRHYLFPTCRYTYTFETADIKTLLLFLARLRNFYAPTKRYKSRKYLTVISYNDFPKIEKLLKAHTFSFF